MILLEEIKEKNKKYSIKYYNNNKNIILEKQKLRREKNKDTINGKLQEKITCICGNIISKRNKSRHTKTKIHLNFMNLK